MGAPRSLMLYIKQLNCIETYLEAGTFQGGTARWMAGEFERVVTIENSHSLYEEARQRHQDAANIEFLFGDSRTRLAEIVPTLQEQAIFWLDSHWCGGESYGESDQCPLLDELEIINAAEIDHIVLIDDARLFLAPPPLSQMT